MDKRGRMIESIRGYLCSTVVSSYFYFWPVLTTRPLVFIWE
jgi:hypothetical protein